MSDDFIQEIKEDVRAEQLLNFVKTYANHLIGGLLAIIFITGGYLYWSSHKASQISQTAQHYEKVLAHLDNHRNGEALARLKEMDPSTKGGKVLKFLSLAQAGDAQALKALSDDTSLPLVYRQFADYLMLLKTFDNTNFKVVLEQVNQLLSKDNAWKHLLLEIKGLALLKGKNIPEAMKIFNELVQDEHTPQALKLRSVAYLETYGKN